MKLTNEHKKIIFDIENIIGEGDFDCIADEFTNGGCYIYAKTISLIIPEAKMYMDKMAEHIVISLDGTFFDSEGTVKYNRNISKFKNGTDDEYCLNVYGFGSPDDSISDIDCYVRDYAYEKASYHDRDRIIERLENYLSMCETLNLNNY